MKKQSTAFSEQTMMDLDNISATKKEVFSATNISDTKDEKISATKYMNQYKRDNYDTVRIDFKKGSKSFLQDEATKRGMSLTQMIKEALRLYLSIN